MTGRLRAVGGIAQTVDLTPVVNAGQCAEGRGTNALLIAARVRKKRITDVILKGKQVWGTTC